MAVVHGCTPCSCCTRNVFFTSSQSFVGCGCGHWFCMASTDAATSETHLMSTLQPDFHNNRLQRNIDSISTSSISHPFQVPNRKQNSHHGMQNGSNCLSVSSDQALWAFHPVVLLSCVFKCQLLLLQYLPQIITGCRAVPQSRCCFPIDHRKIH